MHGEGQTTVWRQEYIKCAGELWAQQSAGVIYLKEIWYRQKCGTKVGVRLRKVLNVGAPGWHGG